MAVKTPQKFTKEDLDKLDNLQTEIDKLTLRFGSLQIAKVKLGIEENVLKNQLTNLTEKEKKLAKQLTTKYGKGSLNIETGEFTPSK